MSLSHVERGRLGETMAASYLQLCGYRILERNYRFGHLEIDLLAARGNLLVVVEVKLRRSTAYGGAAAQVGRRKQRDLETAAVAFLKRHRSGRGQRVRFDVLSLEFGGPGRLVIRHLENAFPASGRYRL